MSSPASVAVKYVSDVRSLVPRGGWSRTPGASAYAMWQSYLTSREWDTSNSARYSDGEPESEMLWIEKWGKTKTYIAPRSLDQILQKVPLT